MELRQLRYFVAVASTGSFSRAAERCQVSQPSLSQQIAKLEGGLKHRLFDRSGRQVLLTDAGRMLLERAESILAAVEDAERKLHESNTLASGQVTLGALPTIAPYLLPRVLKGFMARFPGVEITVHEDVTRQLLEGIATGDLDLALVALPVPDERLHVEPLLTETLYLALPPGHRLVKRRRIALPDLHAERFILLNEMHCLGEQILSFCRANECHPRVGCRSAQISTIQNLIALGQGISLLPEMARKADVTQLPYRRLSGAQPTRTIAVIRRKHRSSGLAVERFVTHLKKESARQGR